MNIDVILVLYAKRRVASTARIVKSIARFIRLRRIIIVVNGMEINPADVQPLFANYCEACTAIPHDNSGLEFGGYQAVDRQYRRQCSDQVHHDRRAQRIRFSSARGYGVV